MKIAVFGGTFNPPHVGHVFAVKELREHADAVWVMVANKPHKESSDLAPARDRLEMSKLAFPFERVEVRGDEIKRGGVSYTCETLALLEQSYPKHEFFWVIGSDLLSDIRYWKNAECLYTKPFWVIFRPYIEIDEKLLAQFNKPRVIRSEGIEISSTKLREWLKKGGYAEAKRYLPPAVFDYVKKKKLYS